MISSCPSQLHALYSRTKTTMYWICTSNNTQLPFINKYSCYFLWEFCVPFNVLNVFQTYHLSRVITYCYNILPYCLLKRNNFVIKKSKWNSFEGWLVWHKCFNGILTSYEKTKQFWVRNHFVLRKSATLQRERKGRIETGWRTI